MVGVLLATTCLGAYACSSDSTNGTPPEGAGSGTVPTKAGLVVNYGLLEYDPAMAGAISDTVGTWLSDAGIPADAATAQVMCPPEGDAVACYDARVFLPFVAERNTEFLRNLVSTDDLSARLLSDATFQPKLTFSRSRGLAGGDSASMLFAFRRMLDAPVGDGSSSDAGDSASGAGTRESGDEQSSPPASTDTWQGYTVQTIEDATVTALNTIFAELVAEPLTFDLTSDCPSTIPELEFCGLLTAEASYSTSELDSTCAGVCEASYDTCEAGIDACKVACCYGCVWGKTCSCPNCGGEESSCEDGCDDVASGSTEIDVKDVTGLQDTLFTSATIPTLESGDSIGETVALKLSPGATASVYWKLCQSGVCVSGTSPMSSSTVELQATGVVTAVACSGGGTALYFSITDIVIEEYGVWGINAFVNEVLGAIDSSMDWLADNISDIFSDDLDAPYQDALNSSIDDIESAVNGLLANAPIVPCPGS